MTVGNMKNELTSKVESFKGRYFEDDSVEFMVECELAWSIKDIMQKDTTFDSKKISAYNTTETRTFTNDSFLDTLRSLYKLTTNSFVKSVIATVGKTKTFTNKQADVIIEEMMKFETIQLS